jgi:hypothetical protein
MFNDFTKTMRERVKKGGDYPLSITFQNAYIICSYYSKSVPSADENDSEIINCDIFIGDNNGCIVIPLKLFSSSSTVYTTEMPNVMHNPSGRLVNEVWKLMDLTMEHDAWCKRWPNNTIDQFFEKLYNSAKTGFNN